LPRFDEPASHGIWLELARLSHGSGGSSNEKGGETRFAERPEGLLDWLAAAYAGVRTGWLDSFACLLPNGKIRWKVGEDTLQSFHDCLRLRPSRILLGFSGLFANDFFASEPGCHLWQPDSAEPEIVRIDQRKESLLSNPREVLEKSLAGIDAFEQALEKGEALPDNPSALAPAVRSLRFRPPMRESEVFSVSYEDSRMSISGTHNVTSLATVIERMLLCWRSRRRQS
jgi:ATP-dependent Clp protease ATP-binding subunit ClpA/ATP-dependent Clp protease ATP-binding subunit ClpC